jgi:predicted dehydrogenase/nucleoside-diphosphate-sugar epimerase
MRSVCLVGAGSIAGVHAEALRAIPSVRLAAVVDPNIEAARRLAAAFGATAHASAEEALATGAIGAAHVLVPPDLHRAVAAPLLAAGIPVLLEKPLAASPAECAELLDAARGSGATLGVNQNFVFHPAFVRLRRLVETRALGRPGFVDCLYNVPLRQFAARQFGHWMFAEPLNLLLEQAVHPLSQLAVLAGPVRETAAFAGPPVEINPAMRVFPTVTTTLDCAHLPAQLRLAVGQPFPFWQVTVVCDDGVIVADILGNRVVTHGRTRWLEAVDGALSATRSGAMLARDGIGNLLGYGLSMLRLRPRSDPFFVSMRGSIAAFHAALDAGTRPETDAAFGAALVETCARIAAKAFPPPAPRPAPALRTGPAAADVAVLGGTGFIGSATVARLLATGRRVAVMARSVRGLGPVFDHPDVALHRGDIRNPADVAAAIGSAPLVVNLAHGGASGSYAQIRAAMVGGAETVARAVLERQARRLIHVGSIASLYLGPQPAPVTGATPPDPRAEERADYARAKAECDRMLMEMHAREALPVVTLRPGLVVGEGTSPFHSGLGFYNNDQHCIGWNAGRNPLPFVLVDDVAAAIVAALDAPGIEGRAFNLVGDVRPSARAYIALLAAALERPLRFHPKRPTSLWAVELGKWAVKRLGGRAAPLPSRRDILSRGLTATFDCSDAKQALSWRPVADHASFVARAITVHAR